MATTSRLRGISRALHVVLTFGAVALIVGSSATADAAKKAKKLKMDPSVPATPEPTGPVAPEPDSMGRVNFGNPTAENLGRVSVKSSSGDRIQVYLDGRYFGDAPVTIYSVPAGDYIVEGTVVSTNKQLSRPVSVTANEESSVDLSAGKIETPASGGSMMSGEISPQRLKVAKGLAIASGAALVLGITFGILEMRAESDYQSTPPANQAKLDDISNTGKRDALLTNLGFALAGACFVGAAIAAYPMFAKPNPEKAAPPPTTTAFVVAPMVGHGTTGGALSLRF
jgi:PEGA domain